MDTPPPSPLDTLRQLKEMLDAGALTPAEFEALKQRLVFSNVPPVPPAAPAFEPVALPPSPAAGQSSPMFEDATGPADAPAAAPVASAFVSPEPALPPAPPPVPFEPGAAPVPAGPEPDANWTSSEFPEAKAPAARNPLALVLSIGGLLALLGLVVYLSLNRPPSEHISSTSQTAADSLAAPIETGPQATPLLQAPAAPETVRVAPARPAPPVPPVPRPAPPARDSAAAVAPAAPPPPDSAARP